MSNVHVRSKEGVPRVISSSVVACPRAGRIFRGDTSIPIYVGIESIPRVYREDDRDCRSCRNNGACQKKAGEFHKGMRLSYHAPTLQMS